MNRCISWMLIALMTVGPERVYALSVEAQAHAVYAKAVAAGVLAQAVPGKFDWSYDYDDNGNLESTTKSDSNGTPVQADVYTYDGENRLATHSLGGALDVTYAYDADGIRTWSKKAGADPTYFLTDKNRPYAQVIEERTWLDPADPDNPDPEDARLAVRYTYGDDLIAQDRVIDPAADPTAAARSYYHYDGQLSTRMLTDAQAAPDTPSTAPPTVTDTYTYDAFGNLLDATTDDGTPTTNNYRYTGEQYDPNLGFYYLRARYYDQGIGRFTTRDSAAGIRQEPASLHRFAYVQNRPIDHIDPSGNFLNAPSTLTTTAVQQEMVAMLVPRVLIGLWLSIKLLNAVAPDADVRILAERLGAGVGTEADLRDLQGPYFIHGSSFGAWRLSSRIRADVGSDNQDFGRGFYTFPLTDPRSFVRAAQRARSTAGLFSGTPFVLVVRSSNFERLRKADFNSLSWAPQYKHIVNRSRNGEDVLTSMRIDLAIGPAAQWAKGQRVWIPNPSFPSQYAFKSEFAVTGLEPILLIPLPKEFSAI